MPSLFSEVFERDNHSCVYCSRDLLHDIDSFLLTHLDHLIPKAHEGSLGLENVVTSCYVCNNLKGEFVPEGATKSERIQSSRIYIAGRRDEKINEEFSTWMGRGELLRKIENPSMDEEVFIYLTIVADTIRRIKEWDQEELTPESFLQRLGETLEDSCEKDLYGIAESEAGVRELHSSLLRSFDVLNHHYRD